MHLSGSIAKRLGGEEGVSRAATAPALGRAAAIRLGARAWPLRSERGWTLIELLLAMVLGVVILGGITSFMIVSLNRETAISSLAEATTQAQSGLNQLTRDLSEAIGSPQTVTVSETSTTASISFDIPNASSGDAAEAVTWTCPYSASPTVAGVGACTRKVCPSSCTVTQPMNGIESATFAPVSSTGSPMTLNSTTSASDPAYIGIALYVEDASRGNTTQTTAVRGLTKPIILNAGVDLRNLG